MRRGMRYVPGGNDPPNTLRKTIGKQTSRSTHVSEESYLPTSLYRSVCVIVCIHRLSLHLCVSVLVSSGRISEHLFWRSATVVIHKYHTNIYIQATIKSQSNGKLRTRIPAIISFASLHYLRAPTSAAHLLIMVTRFFLQWRTLIK